MNNIAKRKASTAVQNKGVYEKNIKKMVTWFAVRGYDVIFGRGLESQIGPEGELEVWINSSLTKENQLYTLLHEAGHLIISERRNYTRRFSHGYPSLSREKYRHRNYTKLHWVHIVHEEVDAWEEGKKLAKLRGIPVKHKKWEKYRANALMSYMQEAVKRWGKTSSKGKTKTTKSANFVASAG